MTPQITPEGNIILDLDINKDSRGETTAAGFAINTKHVQTQVLVENGGTVVIGGIFELTETENEARVPVLGDLPIAGYLFKTARAAATNGNAGLHHAQDGVRPAFQRRPLSARPGALILFLVGMPGSGKSTVGRQLARRLALPSSIPTT